MTAQEAKAIPDEIIRPDCEKFANLAKAIRSIQIPAVTTLEANQAMHNVGKHLRDIAWNCDDFAKGNF